MRCLDVCLAIEAIAALEGISITAAIGTVEDVERNLNNPSHVWEF
jgi:hypothetical protein